MADFNIAIVPLLENEGGYVNDPADPGGETNFGISKRSYPEVDIKNLTADQAKEIYLRDFWRYDGITDQELANKLLDIGVNQGTIIAVEMLQKVIGVPADGKLGPRTLAAANAGDARLNWGSTPLSILERSAPVSILKRLRAASVRRRFTIVEHNPREAKFLEGWVVRDAQ
jgi:lysozyme family protein